MYTYPLYRHTHDGNWFLKRNVTIKATPLKLFHWGWLQSTDLQTNNQQFFTLFHWQPGRDKRNPHLTISPSYRKSKLFKIWVASNVPARFYFVSLHQLILLLCQARIIHWFPNFDTKLIVARSVSIGKVVVNFWSYVLVKKIMIVISGKRCDGNNKLYYQIYSVPPGASHLPSHPCSNIIIFGQNKKQSNFKIFTIL